MLKRDIIDQQDQLKELLQSKCLEILLGDIKTKNRATNDDSGRQSNPHVNAERKWSKFCEVIEKDNDTLMSLNKNIDKFNLIVPLMKSQIFHFNVKREADKIFASTVEKVKRDSENGISVDSSHVQNQGDNVEENKSEYIYKSPAIALDTLIKTLLGLIKGKSKSES